MVDTSWVCIVFWTMIALKNSIFNPEIPTAIAQPYVQGWNGAKWSLSGLGRPKFGRGLYQVICCRRHCCYNNIYRKAYYWCHTHTRTAIYCGKSETRISHSFSSNIVSVMSELVFALVFHNKNPFLKRFSIMFFILQQQRKLPLSQLFLSSEESNLFLVCYTLEVLS